jgi:hypothetical protein
MDDITKRAMEAVDVSLSVFVSETVEGHITWSSVHGDWHGDWWTKPAVRCVLNENGLYRETSTDTSKGGFFTPYSARFARLYEAIIEQQLSKENNEENI